MAICFRGMDAARARDVDRRDDRVAASGLDLSAVGRPTVDKHSTGGVGDKISLVLAPLVAACGAAVPQLSGPRARPHRRHARQAGGDPRLAGVARQRARCSTCCATSARSSAPPATGWRPADRKLYTLRDVTGTVESIPLIACSIMSKKIAEGTERARARREGGMQLHSYPHTGTHSGSTSHFRIPIFRDTIQSEDRRHLASNLSDRRNMHVQYDRLWRCLPKVGGFPVAEEHMILPSIVDHGGSAWLSSGPRRSGMIWRASSFVQFTPSATWRARSCTSVPGAHPALKPSRRCRRCTTCGTCHR